MGKVINLRHAVAAAIGVVATLLVLGLLGDVFARRGAPEPAVDGVAGDHLVVIVDDTNPTIAEGAVLDGPQFDALRAAGKVAIRSTASPLLAKKNYGPLVDQAGGCPAIFSLTDAGDVAYVGRLPDDEGLAEDLVAKILKNCPPANAPPKAASPAINRGGDMPRGTDGAGEFVEVDGHKRYLSAKPDPVKLRAMAPNRYADSHPIYPKSKWRDINRRDVFTWSFFGLDQDGVSSCVANANAAALAKLRTLEGRKPVKLSPGFLYAHINGGRDEGAVISEGADSLVKVGTCPFDLLGQHPFYMSDLTREQIAAAPRYKAGAVYHVDTFEELVSALETGRYLAVFGAMVGPNFGHFDKFGVAGHDRGPGNHALHCDGVAKLPDGRWVFDVPNSWGGSWGPWRNGRVYFDEAHLFKNGDMPDCCVYQVGSEDPLEPWDPPAYSGRKAAKGPEVALAH